MESQPEIQEHCVEYFSNLLGGDHGRPMLEQSDMNILFPFRCSPYQARELELLFSNAKIKESFHSFPRNKTCGLDGFFSKFFIAGWAIFGAEVTEAV